MKGSTLLSSMPRTVILALFVALAVLAGGFAMARAQAGGSSAAGVSPAFVDCNALRCGDG
jgi:hypothetical protein